MSISSRFNFILKKTFAATRLNLLQQDNVELFDILQAQPLFTTYQ